MNYNEATPDYCYGCKSLAHRIEVSEAQRDELLEALDDIIGMARAGRMVHVINRAKAAIAKAKGEYND